MISKIYLFFGVSVIQVKAVGRRRERERERGGGGIWSLSKPYRVEIKGVSTFNEKYVAQIILTFV